MASLTGHDLAVSDYLELMGCLTAKKVAEYLQNDQALLLTTIYREFVEEAQSKASLYMSGAVHIPSIRWLLSRLHLYFGSMLIVQCKCRRYRSIVYLHGCDLVKTLSAALGKSQTTPKFSQETEKQPPLPQPSNIDEKVEDVTSFINDRMHMQARKIVAADENSPRKLQSFKLDRLVGELDPVLVSFIKKITQSVRARKRIAFFRMQTLLFSRQNTYGKYMLSVYCYSAQTLHAACHCTSC